MGVQKRTRKFAQVKRVIGQRDARLKKNIVKNEAAQKEKAKKDQSGELIREMYVSHHHDPLSRPHTSHTS